MVQTWVVPQITYNVISMYEEFPIKLVVAATGFVISHFQSNTLKKKKNYHQFYFFLFFLQSPKLIKASKKLGG